MRWPPAMPVILVLVAALYFAAGKLGLSFATLNDSASAVWPPTGLAIAAGLVFGRRIWPAVFAGAFLVNFTTSGSAATSIGIAAGNTLEAVVAVLLVERHAGGAACFDRARDVFRFAVLAAVASTAISASIGVASLALGGLARWEELGPVWLTWWLGDAAGAMLVAPLLVLWLRYPTQALPGEALLALLAVMAVGAACFAAPVLRDYPLVFLTLPPLAWIAFRFGPREVATANVLLASIAVLATETGVGPFAMAARNESLLVLQAFMGMVAMTLLPTAALVRENRAAVAQAEAATRARDVFLAMLSHELRNPLQAIASSLHIVGRAGTKPDEAGRAVAIASRQSQHLSRLLNDLLDVARAVSGKVMLDTRPVRLDDAARACVESLRAGPRLGARTLVLEAEEVTVDGDPGRIDQIVGNLLGNAIKFTSASGAIRVVVRSEEGVGVLRVRDDGIGIAPELLPRVFELFTQGERTLERSEGGLGIGLTLVRTLAELQGGSAEARSEGPGRGSELEVRLPLSASPVVASPPSKGEACPPRRVLIVEDNADARESLRAVLEAEGHQVEEAADGEEAVAAAERTRPDVVLVDIGLPRVDGYEVARRLRAREAALGVRWKLVALTGYGQPEDVRRAAEAGFDRHLVKPVFPEALRESLAQP